MKNIIITLFLSALLAVTSAYAGNIPEFDAVGDDSANYFNDDIIAGLIINAPYNNDSDWTNILPDEELPHEFFETQAGPLRPDLCFEGYFSALTDVWNIGVYEWQIVLQMKPESDIDINIVDCVSKHNALDVYFEAEQTGRYRESSGQLRFIPSANPTMSAMAYPGPFATPGFIAPVGLDARTMPTLAALLLQDQAYTSKAFWDESIVVVLPENGVPNSAGTMMYNLKQGDRINIVVKVPSNNSVDLRYGPDNIILKYIGIVGTDYVFSDPL